MAARRRAEAPKEKNRPEEAEGIDREALLATLGRLKPALRVGGALPELEHIWFGGDYARAYDGGLGIRLAAEAGLDCGVPGRVLLGLLGTSALKQAEFAQEDAALAVKLGRSRTKLNVLASDRDPWPFPADHGKAAKLSEAAVEALRSVLIAKASPATRLEHHGVAVYCSGADVDIYATDSRTLAQAAISEKGAGLPKFLFLPRPLVEQVVALCPQGARLYVAEDHLAVVADGVEICSNVLDTTGLADLPALVRRHHDAHPDPVALPAGLEAALDRADVLAGGGGEAAVTLTIREKKFGLAGRYQYGELREELVLEAAHPAAELAVATTALRRGLLAADAFSATEGSLAFYGGENFLYLVSSQGK